MNLRPRRCDDVEINLISLIDILLFLVIFFMVSTTFVEKSEVALTLPEATTDAPPAAENQIEVTIAAHGGYHVNGNALADTGLATVERAMAEAAKPLRDPVVIINADAKTTHQSVVTALDAARRLGLLRVTFATEASGQP
jgi:biopolymer transport protein ExbD